MGPIVKGQEIKFLYFLTLEDGTKRLYQNVGKVVPPYTEWYPKKTADLIYIMVEAWNQAGFFFWYCVFLKMKACDSVRVGSSYISLNIMYLLSDHMM
jgi:hypothetical protein